jgi:hypothetical protein
VARIYHNKLPTPANKHIEFKNIYRKWIMVKAPNFQNIPYELLKYLLYRSPISPRRNSPNQETPRSAPTLRTNCGDTNKSRPVLQSLNAPTMIQLKVQATQSKNPSQFPLTPPLPDITKLHRQLRRLGRRVRQRPEEAAGRNDRSVPQTRTELEHASDESRLQRIQCANAGCVSR